MPGTLYVVSTPIGNLEDITYRAVRILGEVDLIACEDTRQTQKLLQRYAIGRPLVSYHEHNEAERTPELLRRLQEGESVALVSDAGTPLISDPGYRLVHQAAAAAVPVVSLPGPSAVLAALTASGLPTDAFFFGGFLPAKSGQRRKALESWQDVPATLVFYEAPHRVLETLRDLHEVVGPRPMALARELTKLHEELLRGTPAELLASLEQRALVRGEVTLVVGRAEERQQEGPPIPEAVAERVRAGESPMDAVKAVARERNIAKREVYRLYQESGSRP